MSDLIAGRAKRTISMSLVRDLTTGTWFIEQVELRFGVVRSLLSFSGRLELVNAFEPRFLGKLQEFLPMKMDQHVLSVSGTAIELPTVTLSDLRVLTQRAMDGIQRVIIRINHVFGRIYDFLRIEHRPDAVPIDLDEAAYLETLIDDGSEGPAAVLAPTDRRYCQLGRN